MQSDEYKRHIAECYLDAEQKSFLDSETNTIIKAGPGTGKTRVLTLKAAKLLFEKIEYPRGLACITYTNKAAQELKNRLKTYGIKNRRNLFVDTIHKFCISNILFRYSFFKEQYCNVSKCKIVKNSKEYMDKYFNYFSIDNAKKREYEKFLKEYKYKKYNQQEKADKLYKYYFDLFYSNNLLNFDLILDVCNEIILDDYVCKCIESKYPYLLIDEYQDSSIAMHSLFKTLMNKTNIIFYIVGDPDQAIYGFTASSPKYYSEFYKSKKFEKIEFRTNYRTVNKIPSIAGNILPNGNKKSINNLDKSCFFKKCDSLENQIEYIIINILPKLKEKNFLFKDICILYRDYQTEEKIISILKEYNISFVDNNKIYVDKDFNDSDLIVFFEDIVLWILKQRKSNKELSFKEIYLDYIKIFYSNKILYAEKKNEIKVNLYKLLTKYQNVKNLSLKIFMDDLNKEMRCFDLLKQNNEEEIKAYENFCNKTLDYTIEQFSKMVESEESIRLISSHSSKGLEFKVVIIPDLEDGRYPDWRSETTTEQLDEERRLLFVAMTRAKEFLFLLASGYYYSKTTRFDKGISRFLNDIKLLDADEFN